MSLRRWPSSGLVVGRGGWLDGGLQTASGLSSWATSCQKSFAEVFDRHHTHQGRALVRPASHSKNYCTKMIPAASNFCRIRPGRVALIALTGSLVPLRVCQQCDWRRRRLFPKTNRPACEYFFHHDDEVVASLVALNHSF